MKQIELYANIKSVSSKDLVSGDKEVRIILSVVGADVISAIELANVPVGEMVRIIYEPNKN